MGVRSYEKHTVANNGRYVTVTTNLANNGGWNFHQNVRSKMMKAKIKLAFAASVLAAPALGAEIPGLYHTTSQNMENPLYLPARNMFYSKLSNGVMLKVADNSQAHKLREHDGKTEFPIIRIQEEIGYGITDRWAVHASAQYTHDDDIDRTGLSAGRLGTTYRVLALDNGIVWDLYADLHLGGLGKMRGQYDLMSLVPPQGVFEYDNYSNGMWGYHVGTKVGKTWRRFTMSAFVEMLQTFGDDNTRIRIAVDQKLKNAAIMGAMMGDPTGALSVLALPNEVSVDLKSTTEVNAGLNTFYQWTSRWSSGAWFRYNHHADQGVSHIVSDLGAAESMRDIFEAKLSDMNDGFDEYIIGLSVANQVTEHAQVALYGEYTFDTAHAMSQNGTDVKAEVGVRLNFTF